jgi:hypothetical protein
LPEKQLAGSSILTFAKTIGGADGLHLFRFLFAAGQFKSAVCRPAACRHKIQFLIFDFKTLYFKQRGIKNGWKK